MQINSKRKKKGISICKKQPGIFTNKQKKAFKYQIKNIILFLKILTKVSRKVKQKLLCWFESSQEFSDTYPK